MVRLGGAGNKVNRIAFNEADCYLQPRKGLKFWDLCAPEAVLRAMGGNLVTIPVNQDVTEWQKLKRICYDVDRNGGSSTCEAFSACKSIKM